MSKETKIAYQVLVNVADSLKQSYKNDVSTWENSPFQWLKEGASSRTKGKIGEEIVSKFLQSNGFSVHSTTDSEADLVVDGKRMEVKLSTLWAQNLYKFQQIRDQRYDLLFCLGLSPNDAHAWITKKSDINWEDLRTQYKRGEGQDTRWISCTPAHSPHSFLLPNNGDLSKICDHLRKAIATL